MVTLQVRLNQSLVQRIDRYRLSLTLRPSRSQMIRYLVGHAMSISEEQLKNAISKERE